MTVITAGEEKSKTADNAARVSFRGNDNGAVNLPLFEENKERNISGPLERALRFVNSFDRTDIELLTV